MTNEGPHDQVISMRHSTPYALSIGLLLASVGCTTTTVNDGGHGGGPTNDGGNPGSPTTIASLIQDPPARMFSDGTTLYWSNDSGNTPIFSIPVAGGSISTVVPTSGGWLVGVDDTSVYYTDESDALYRSAKGGGGSATLISEPGALVRGVTISGGRAYWAEYPSPNNNAPLWPITVKSAALQGGPVSTVATFSANGPPPEPQLGVTATTVFVAGLGLQQQLAAFPLTSGVPDGGMPAPVPGVVGCQDLYPDTDAVYCLNGNVERVTSEGSASTLGMILSNTERGGVVAHDDSYVYWVDSVTVGTIMKVPKTGGTASVIARDTEPIAIAVDAHAIYWSDDGGNIMRLEK